MSDHVLPVLEIFKSIQGEGSHTGQLATFIRLAGCNLNCSWCDTQDTMKMVPYSMKLSEIVLKAVYYEAPLVVITGGEPTIHGLTVLGTLINDLAWRGFLVSIETNGTNPTPFIRNNLWVTCSPKPSTGYQIHPKCIYDELKYVVDDTFTLSVIPEDAFFKAPIFVQPESMKKESIKRCIELVHEDPRLILGVQLHKILEVQ